MPITHSKVSLVADSDNTSLVQPSDWNEDHVADSLAIGGTGALSGAEALRVSGLVRVEDATGASGGVLSAATGGGLAVSGASFQLLGTSSGYVGLKSPSAPSSSVIYTLPNADGTVGQTLVTNGGGVLSWSDPVATGSGIGIQALSGLTGSTQFLAAGTDLSLASVSGTQTHTFSLSANVPRLNALSVYTAAGDYLWTGSTAGAMALRVRNVSTGTGAYAYYGLSNDTGELAYFALFSSTFPGGYGNEARLEGNYGLTLSSITGSVDFYSNNLLRGQFLTTGGQFTVTSGARIQGGGGTGFTGAGLELSYDSGATTAYVQSYDRSSGIYRHLALYGQTVLLSASGAAYQQVTVTGMNGSAPIAVVNTGVSYAPTDYAAGFTVWTNPTPTTGSYGTTMPDQSMLLLRQGSGSYSAPSLQHDANFQDFVGLNIVVTSDDRRNNASVPPSRIWAMNTTTNINLGYDIAGYGWECDINNVGTDAVDPNGALSKVGIGIVAGADGGDANYKRLSAAFSCLTTRTAVNPTGAYTAYDTGTGSLPAQTGGGFHYGLHCQGVTDAVVKYTSTFGSSVAQPTSFLYTDSYHHWILKAPYFNIGFSAMGYVDQALGVGAAGCELILGRNTSVSGSAGLLVLVGKGGTPYYLWVDNDGKLRIGTTPPVEGVDDTGIGTVVGQQ